MRPSERTSGAVPAAGAIDEPFDHSGSNEDGRFLAHYLDRVALYM